MDRVSLVALVLLGCGSPEAPTEEESLNGIAALTCGDDEAVIRMTTSDDVKLVADYWPAAAAQAPVVILVHMTPDGGFNRADWPVEVRRSLHDLGLNVLALDRRGAGDSEGRGSDAYTGEGGRLDLEAAVTKLQDSGCAADFGQLYLVGASNGTTSVLDYTASHDPALPDTTRMVFMSPGEYTEAQHTLDDVDPTVPLLWLYPTNEPFSGTRIAGAPATWEFVERGLQHGTRMFDGDSLQADTLADLVRVLTP